MRRASLPGLICLCLATSVVAQQPEERVTRPDGARRTPSERSSLTRFGAAQDSTAPTDFQIYRAQNPAQDLGNTLNLLFRDRKDIVIVPDAISNTLLIRAEADMLKRLNEALGELDRSPQSIAFEVYLLDFQSAINRPVAAAGDESSKNPPASSELKGPADKVFATIGQWEEQGRVKVLNHFELTAIDNNPTRIQFGGRKPRVTGAQLGGRGGGGNPWGGATSISMENVGTLVGVTARADSAGGIVAQVDFEKSFLGSDEEGKVIVEAAEGRDRIVAPSMTTLSINQTIQLSSGAAQPIAAAAGKSDITEPGRYLLVIAASVEKSKSKD